MIGSPCLGVCTHCDPIMCAWLRARTIPRWPLSCQSTALEQLLWGAQLTDTRPAQLTNHTPRQTDKRTPRPHHLLSCQSTALEQLLWRVFKLAEAQTPAVREAAFVEWWCHCRPHCSGHQMHFDSEDEGRGGVSVALACLTQSVRGHCLDWDSPTRRLMCSRHGHEQASPRGVQEVSATPSSRPCCTSPARTSVGRRWSRTKPWRPCGSPSEGGCCTLGTTAWRCGVHCALQPVVLTEMSLCDVCSCHELLRAQRTRAGLRWASAARSGPRPWCAQCPDAAPHTRHTK
eukprot:COSAG01_NODE_13398_length_1591_cov_1.299598_2_plen_288_part_00